MILEIQSLARGSIIQQITEIKANKASHSPVIVEKHIFRFLSDVSRSVLCARHLDADWIQENVYASADESKPCSHTDAGVAART